MTTPIWQVACAMLAYTAFLFAVSEFARRRVRMFLVLQVIVLATVPFWILDISGSWFKVAKLLSCVIPSIVYSASRVAWQEGELTPLRRFLRGNWAYVFAYSCILVNIAEVALYDFLGGRYFHVFSGGVLGLTMGNPFGDKAWSIETETPRREALVRLSPAWTVLYTTWNLASLYAMDPVYLAHVGSLLVAPLVYSLLLGRPDLWMSARIYTTLAAVIILWGGHDFVTPFMDTTPLRSPQAVLWWGALNAVLFACYLARWLTQRGKVSWGLPGMAKTALRSSAAK
jgi:hypothetical protein